MEGCKKDRKTNIKKKMNRYIKDEQMDIKMYRYKEDRYTQKKIDDLQEELFGEQTRLSLAETTRKYDFQKQQNFIYSRKGHNLPLEEISK